MSSTATKNKITVPRTEYLRLKKLEGHFGEFWSYVERLIEIRIARDEVRNGKIISQEKLFKRLGL